MPGKVTAEQVVEAARALGSDEFTRGDLAQQLGVEKPEIRRGVQQAKKAGLLEKTRDDEEGTGHFRLTAAAG
jgi:DNA-binding transcriptional regulator LsrR (DeoR family)